MNIDRFIADLSRRQKSWLSVAVHWGVIISGTGFLCGLVWLGRYHPLVFLGSAIGILTTFVVVWVSNKFYEIGSSW